MVPKAAKVEDVGLDSSLSNGATATSNPLALDELTDIIRWAPRSWGLCLVPKHGVPAQHSRTCRGFYGPFDKKHW